MHGVVLVFWLVLGEEEKCLVFCHLIGILTCFCHSCFLCPEEGLLRRLGNLKVTPSDMCCCLKLVVPWARKT